MSAFVPEYIADDDDRKKLLEIIKKRAVLHGEFVLASGQKSRIYIDIKRVSLTSDGLELISKLFSRIILREFGTRSVAGVELGGVPLAVGTMLKLRELGHPSSAIVIRKKRKEHGTRGWIEGEPVRTVVLLEDVITTGGTSLDAVRKLEESGISAEGVICVADRGGCKNLAQKNLKVFCLFHISEILPDSFAL